MKSKASMIVLLAEIVAIVILHTARNSGTDRPTAANQPSQSNQFTLAAERPTPYISLK